MSEILSAPVVETPKLPETELQKNMTPAVARVMFSSVDKKFYNPDKKSPTPEETKALARKTERDMSYKALAELSLDSRAKYWKDRTGDAPQTFAQQNKNWNSETAELLREQSASLEPSSLTERNAALKSLGLDMDDQAVWEGKSYEFKSAESDTTESVMLITGVEEFRKKYLRSHSEVEKFVSDIANDCRPAPDQPVNMDLLTKRLHSVSSLMTSFGQDYAIDKMVNQFAVSHGLLSQNAEDKALLSQKAQEQMAAALPDDLNDGFKAIAAKQHELDTITERAKTQAEEEIKQEAIDAQDEVIKQKIEQAKSTALSHDNWDKIRAEEEEIERKFATGEYSSAKRNEEINKLEQKRGGVMQFKNVSDFARALELLGKPPQQIAEDIKHEQAHFEKANEHQLNPLFEIQVSKGSGDTMYPNIMVRYDTPEELSENENREIIREVLLAPGLSRISRNDAAGAGYEWTDIEDARAVINSPEVSEKIRTLSGDIDKGKRQFEYGILDAIKQEREEINKIYEGRNLPNSSEIPTEPPITEATADELVETYLKAAIKTSGAPEDLLAQINNDEDAKTTISESIKNKAMDKVRLALSGEIQNPNFSILQTTSLSAALKAHGDGASVLLPIGNKHMGLLEPGSENIIRDSGGELMIRLRDVRDDQPIILPLKSLFQSEVSFMNGLTHTGSSPMPEDVAAKSSPVFIMHTSA